MITTIKQYGEIRTGTNYLRALIMRNYPDVQMLSYILGSKHLPPAPFDAIWDASRQAGDTAAFDFVSSATYSRRGGASHPGDPTQRAELVRRAPAIAQAYVTNSLGFLVTIKHPYAWVVSAAQFLGWVCGDERIGDWSLELMKEACQNYTRKYRAWSELVREHGSRARLIRYEDLMVEPEQVLGKIAEQFRWRRATRFSAVSAVIEPTHWDHLPVMEAEETFRPEYYRNAEYLDRLSATHLRLIDQLMDWELLGSLGYDKR